MEILLIIGILIVLVLIFAQSFLPLVISILWLIGLFAVLCVLFFVAAAVFALAARPRPADFVQVEKDERGIWFAIYEVDGNLYRNLFPTDSFLRKILYRKKEAKVRFLKVRSIELLFDKVTLWVIGIGLPVFALIAFLVFSLIGTF